MQDTEHNDISLESQQRMERLSRRAAVQDVGYGYSNFVRIMRFALPMAAVAMVVVVFMGSGIEEPVVSPIERTIKDAVEPVIAKNELLNPKFESADKKKQPYKITADRALQGETNKDLIMLDKPVGLITMEDGIKVTMRSETGAYRQDTERFFLQGDVHLQHEQGYELKSEEAHVDLQKNYAWSEKDVRGEGPDLSIDAKGVRADGETGEIIFTGPATLVLDNGFGGVQ